MHYIYICIIYIYIYIYIYICMYVLHIYALSISITFSSKLDYFFQGFRLDRNKHGGGILLYIRNNINPILLTDHVLPNDIEAFFTEIKVNTCKRLVCCPHNPNRINVSTHLEQIRKALDI